MGKEKFTLADLQVQSFITSLDPAEMSQVKGGYMIVKGRRFTYRTRWTSVDTRADLTDQMVNPGTSSLG